MTNNWDRIVLIPVILIFLFLSFLYQDFIVDDAYISFVYSKNLVEGNGLTYNGLVVEGYSNFLWVMIMAPFIALDWDPLNAARFVSIFSACLSLFLLQKLIRRFTPEISSLMLGMALLSVAVIAPFTAWSMGGLETIFFAFLIISFIYVETHENQKVKEFSPYVVLICALTRPEGIMFFPIMVFYRLIINKQFNRDLLFATLKFLIPFLVYLFWRINTYGFLLPNTAFLKLHPSMDTIQLALSWLMDFLRLRPLTGVIALAALVILYRGRDTSYSGWPLIHLTILAFIAFILYSGRDWMPHHRFLAPVVPLLGLYFGRALSAFRNRAAKIMTISVLLAGVTMELFMTITVFIPYSPQFGNYTRGLIRGGLWINENTQEDDVIAVVDAGVLAYYSERKTIDILGLNDVHIAHSVGKRDLEYAFLQDPVLFQLHFAFTTPEEFFIPGGESINESVINYPGFLDIYEPYYAGTEDPFFPFLFLRMKVSESDTK